MQTTEIIASIFGVLCVALLIYRNHWSWPIGLVQIILTGIVLWETKLYAETGLQVVFAVLQLYGWWAWINSPKQPPSENRANEQIRVERLRPRGSFLVLATTAASTAFLSWLLISYTDGQSPILDAFIASASLAAQCLLTARYIENWHYWIVVDIVSIPLYLSRELYGFAILYVLFLALAFSGWYNWRLALRQQTIAEEDS